MSDPHSHPRGQGPAPEVVSSREAAQGRRGTGVFRILLISLALIVIVFVVIYALYAPKLSTHHGAGGESGVTSHVEANTFHAPEPGPKPAPANGSAESSSNQPTPH